MELNQDERRRLSQRTGVPFHELSTEKINSLLTGARPINIMGLMNAEAGPFEFCKSEPASSSNVRLARVFNHLLLTHFESVGDLLRALNLNYRCIASIYRGEKLRKTGPLYTQLMRQYNINILFLTGYNDTMVSQRVATAAQCQ